MQFILAHLALIGMLWVAFALLFIGTISRPGARFGWNMLAGAAFIAVIGLSLAGCSTFQSQTPQQKLDSVKLGVTAAETFYHGLCNSQKAPAVCYDAKAVAIEQSAEITVAAAISAAQVAITDGTSSSDQTDALVAAALSAAIAIEQAVAVAQTPPT